MIWGYSGSNWSFLLLSSQPQSASTSWVKKKKSLQSFLLCVSFTLTLLPHSQHCWLHNRQFSDTSWLSYNLTQFNSLWHCPPRDSTRSHRLGAQSHKTAPNSLQLPAANLYCHLCFWPIYLRFPLHPRLGFDYFAKWLTELRQTLTFTNLLKNVIKDTNE